MQRIPPPQPGVYFGVPAHEYHEWEAINFSALKHARDTMADVRWNLDAPEQTSEQMAFGTMLHAAMLEPEMLATRTIAPPTKPNGEVYKTRDAQGVLDYMAKNPGKVIAWPDDMEAIRQIRANMLAHPEMAKGLSQRIPGGRDCNVEVSYTWVDPETGVRCKARADFIVWAKGDKPGMRVDFKSCADPSADGFARSVEQHGYHIQNHMQDEGLRVLGYHNIRGLWFAVQNKGPYKVAVYEPMTQAMSPTAIIESYAETEYRMALNEYAQCLKSGIWPGLPTDVRPIDLRTYYASRYVGGAAHN